VAGLRIRNRTRAAAARPERVRAWNERFVAQARRRHFSSRVPVCCECDDPYCRGFLLLTPDDYHHARDDVEFLTIPEHAHCEAAPSEQAAASPPRLEAPEAVSAPT
jgi:hypothetical protein